MGVGASPKKLDPELLNLDVVPVAGPGVAAGLCTAQGGRLSPVTLPPSARQGWDASTYCMEPLGDYLVFAHWFEWIWAPMTVCSPNGGKGGGFFGTKEAFLSTI